MHRHHQEPSMATQQAHQQHPHRQWGWTLVLSMLTTALLASPLGSAAAPRQKPVPTAVSIKILEFVPQEITVPIGTRVAWVNDGGRHQIVADNGTFTSPNLTADKQQFASTFRQTGIFPYHCSFHGGPGGKGMAGIIKVIERTP